MANIVLAHGFLGFGAVVPEQPINYFNGIAELYARRGHIVLESSVAPIGSIEERAIQLESQIDAKFKAINGPIFLLGHSMGGLDCRRFLAKGSPLAKRVRRLITIATPHYGSPVANAVLDNSGFLLNPAEWLNRYFAGHIGALKDLQLRRELHDESVDGVEYLCIGCDSEEVKWSPVFAVTEAIGEFGKQVNDGVVSLKSASKDIDGELFEKWSVDHGGAIGWPSGGLVWQIANAAARPPKEHLERYEDLLDRLIRL